MLAMEELLCELSDHEKRNEQGLPPGFRFHPTDEELITYYLASKVFNGSFTNIKFAEVDLNRCEPWELPDVAKMGEREWYLFSLRDRKYPTGLRTNRATGAGYWKATGKDKEVYSGTRNRTLLGMKKTLVFYKGRAPRGEKTKWVMHEYRLDAHFSLPTHTHTSTVQNLFHVRRANQEEWVICRIFHKSGEKRTPMLQVQGHSVSDASSSQTKPLTSFTTLELESQSQSSSQRDLQCPVLIHHHQDQNDLSHIFPLHSSPHPSFSDLLFKQQNCTLKTTKTEDTTFYQLLDDHNNLRWANKLNQNPSNSFLNSFPLDHHHQVDVGLMPANANAQPFNRIGLQQVLDPPDHIGIDSWPLPQHV